MVQFELDMAKKYNLMITESNSQIVHDGTESRNEVIFKVSCDNRNFNIDAFKDVLESRTKAINIQILNHH